MEEKAKPWRESGCRCGKHKQILGESREKFRQEENEREQKNVGSTRKTTLRLLTLKNSLLYYVNHHKTACLIDLVLMDFFNQSECLFVLTK